MALQSESNNLGSFQKAKNYGRRKSRRIRLFSALARLARNFRYNPFQSRRDGRVAEGGGLLNRCTVKSCTGGSNPPLSATQFAVYFIRLTFPKDPEISTLSQNFLKHCR
jgi:hypothetical protein